MYNFHYHYIKNKYVKNSRPLFNDADSMMYKIKAEVAMKILVRIKECLILVNFKLSQNIVMGQTS